jgi:hypothetical protein
LWAAGFAALVVALWAFPRVWYTRSGQQAKPVWLTERTNLVGWAYRRIPVTESAERLLVADRTVSGEFVGDDQQQAVRVFSAKRYTAKPHDIGLFVHTPDRCWTQGGWKFEPIVPDKIELTVQGMPLVFERRLFVAGEQRELVYFGGLVAGQPLPYRLDHNLSVGMRLAIDKATQDHGGQGAALRASDKLFWQRVWDAFKARRQILGPKQFIRVSTSVTGADLEAGDRLLQSFLETWLVPEDYQAELQAWLTQKP